jgi:hypothetical protein
MTALVNLISREARVKLLERMRELNELASLMEERRELPTAPAPVPLHRAGREEAER